MKGETLTNAWGPRARYLRITTERQKERKGEEKGEEKAKERKREKQKSIVVL